MEHVAFDAVDPQPYDGDWQTDRRPLTESLGAEHVAITRYVLDPGERLSGSVHAHADQEEIFVVLAGEATFEVEAPDETASESDADEASDGGLEEIRVAADEAIRFAPGEFQSGRNDGGDPVVALALGAPRDSDDVRISRIPVLEDRDVSCPDCECDHMRVGSDVDAEFVCPACGATMDLE
ncbi:cupin domain-containing protein [Halopiger goleimassiliensis]|uniref:cupin domain-containing protein n=1 Tax=Halopiger goleimassiliensis TaxID=1293048 RepID=UPI0006782E5B|nr:cupin domain-containing protein [Halopiger goleimassiliensis]